MNALLIVNYNDYDSTIKLINNVIDYKILDKILVVDNNSTDNSYIRLKKIKKDKLEVINTNSNKGYSYAINYGSKYLINNGECNIIVSNSDIIINKEMDLKLLIDDLKDNDLVGPVVNEHGNISRGWKIPSPLIDIGSNLVYFHKLIKNKYMYYKDSYYKDSITRVEVVSGCFFLIKSKTLESINYLDENVFLYYEENILGTKLKHSKIVVDNRVTIIHNHSVTIDKNISKIKKYKALKKSQYYFEKNYNHATKIELILLFITNKLSLVILYLVYLIKDII